VARIIVDVMLKPEIHDPQGEAIAGACHRLGFTEVVSVRQGKRFEVEVAAGGAADAANPADGADRPAVGDPAIRVAELAAELLANPVIEEFAIRDA
jgi:phosphoribosylformylglycinamidine synthase PurS subunit